MRPASWAEVYDALFADTFNPRIGRYKSRFAFRGVSSEKYDMKSSLMRLGGDFPSVEHHLLRQFKKYAHDFVKSRDNEWYWLSVAQHYGLPTRLLDWTYSPEIALHFATCNTSKYSDDGVVWKVNYKKAHQELPPTIRGVIEEENTWILTTELLNNSMKNLIDLDKIGKMKGDFVIFFEPPSIDQRIFNQFAYFSLPSRADLKMIDWLEKRPHIWQKVIIPAELKWEIRDKLDQSNVSERILFPGLEGITAWLRRYYMPR